MPLPSLTLQEPAPPPAPAAGLDEAAEARLVALVAAGDLRAFELLYKLYHPRLTRFIGRMARRPAVVDEVLDDTLLVVWRRADSYNGRSKVATWIFAIAYRKTLKALQRLDEPADDEAGEDRIEPGPGPEQQLDLAQVRRALKAAMGQLTPEHRAVIDLTYFHGLACREIAEIVGCPVDTVKTRMFHARRRLKALLPGGSEAWL